MSQLRTQDQPRFDGLSQVRNKCQFWREHMHDEDRFDSDLKARDRRVRCSCFVEGHVWEATVQTVPEDCPDCFRCRYFIRT